MEGQEVSCEERRAKSKEAKAHVLKGLSEVLLEKMQERNLIMFSRLGTSDAVSLIGINLKNRRKSIMIHCLISSILTLFSPSLIIAIR